MANAISDLIENGIQLELDLLLDVPNSNVKATWKLPAWRGYKSVFGQTLVSRNGLPGGIQFRILGQFLASEGIWPIYAIGISHLGSVLFVAPMKANGICTSITPFPVEITGFIQPIQA